MLSLSDDLYVEALNSGGGEIFPGRPRTPSCNRVSASLLLNTIFHVEINLNVSGKIFTHEGNNLGLLGKSFPFFNSGDFYESPS